MFKQGHECLPAVVALAAKGLMEMPGIQKKNEKLILDFHPKKTNPHDLRSLDKSRTRRSGASNLHVLRTVTTNQETIERCWNARWLQVNLGEKERDRQHFFRKSLKCVIRTSNN